MRIINVIIVKNGVIDSIESFGIFEEQLSDDVATVAVKDFSEKAIKLGADPEMVEQYCEDGFFESIVENASVCLTWSSID